MLTCRVQKIPSPTHRSMLTMKIKRLRAIIMILCTSYARARILYVFSKDSSKCSKCTYKEVSYDGNFSKADFDELLKEKDRLEATRTRVIVKAASLNKRIKAL
jgi:hypothetical protein